MTRQEVNSLAGRLIWAVDTDMMNTIRKNGGESSCDHCLPKTSRLTANAASRALVAPDTILPTFLLDLKTSLDIRDEVRVEINTEVNVEARDEISSEATIVVQDKSSLEQGHRAVPRDSVMEEARDAVILEEFNMAPFV